VTPPDTLRLTEEVGEAEGSRFEKGRNLVRPVIDGGRTPSAYWIHESAGVIRVLWTNGFSGTRLELTATEHGILTGVAEAFTDVVGPTRPRTEAMLRPVRCPGTLEPR